MAEAPLADPIEEAGRIGAAATKAGVKVKLLGGAGIHLHSPSATRAPLKRRYGDLDFAIAKKHRKGVLELFPRVGLPTEHGEALLSTFSSCSLTKPATIWE